MQFVWQEQKYIGVCRTFLPDAYVDFSELWWQLLLFACYHIVYKPIFLKHNNIVNWLVTWNMFRATVNYMENRPLHIAWTHTDAFLKERNFFRMICVRIFPWIVFAAALRTSVLLASNSAIWPALRKTFVFPIWEYRSMLMWWKLENKHQDLVFISLLVLWL